MLITDPTIDSNRLKILFIDPTFLISLFTRGAAWLLSTGLPADAQVLDCGYSPERRGFYLTVQHPSFDPVPSGEILPTVFPVQITTIPNPAQLPPRTPALGDRVCFVYGDRHLPALISNPDHRTDSPEPFQQEVTVFPEGEPYFSTVARYDPAGTPATWHWPGAAGCDAN